MKINSFGGRVIRKNILSRRNPGQIFRSAVERADVDEDRLLIVPISVSKTEGWRNVMQLRKESHLEA